MAPLRWIRSRRVRRRSRPGGASSAADQIPPPLVVQAAVRRPEHVGSLAAVEVGMVARLDIRGEGVEVVLDLEAEPEEVAESVERLGHARAGPGDRRPQDQRAGDAVPRCLAQVRLDDLVLGQLVERAVVVQDVEGLAQTRLEEHVGHQAGGPAQGAVVEPRAAQEAHPERKEQVAGDQAEVGRALPLGRVVGLVGVEADRLVQGGPVPADDAAVDQVVVDEHEGVEHFQTAGRQDDREWAAGPADRSGSGTTPGKAGGGAASPPGGRTRRGGP